MVTFFKNRGDNQQGPLYLMPLLDSENEEMTRDCADHCGSWSMS